jgi:hypothetical protein
MLFTAAFFAVGYLVTKILADEVPAAVVVFMLSVMVPVVLAPVAMTSGCRSGWGDLGWLFVTAVFATGGITR